MRILEMCNTADGATSGEIWDDPELHRMRQKYARVTFMDLVKSLKRVDFLFDTKKTRGNLYFITVAGREALERMKGGNLNGGGPAIPMDGEGLEISLDGEGD